MNEADHKERLRLLTGEALGKLAEVEAEIERRGSAPPRPGDVYLLPETAELAIEWAVIVEEPGSGRYLVVPADTHPLVGSADVGVPEEGKSGPLSLRCGFGMWLAAEAFDPQRRTGLLEPFYVGRAKRKVKEIEAGTLVGTALEREVDEDPDYEDWAAEVLGPARAALSAWGVAPGGARPEEKRPSYVGDRRPWYAVAAMFAVATLGLSTWVNLLWQRLDEPSGPVFAFSADPEIRFNDQLRNGDPIEVPAGVTNVTLFLSLDTATPTYPSYRLRLLDHEGEEIKESSELPGDHDQFTVTLPRGTSRIAEYRLVLYGIDGDQVDLLEEKLIRIEFQ